MKTSKQLFTVLFCLFVLSIFICSSISYADGAPVAPEISIRNATINGMPFSYGCGFVANFGVNSLMEFDIRILSHSDASTLVSYTFSPPAPPGTFTFTPSLPFVSLDDLMTIHFSWITPTPYFGTMNISVVDFLFKENCQLNFDWALPVELSSFVSLVYGNSVTLNWSTSSEINNSGFDVERRDARSETQDVWIKIGSVNGNGTISSPNNYEFTDRNLSSGKYKYRLKQIDFNGNFEYFNLSGDVLIGIPDKFSLSQNYPNPFNPTTKISYELPFDGKVSLTIFDITGKEVMDMINENKSAGYYETTMDGSNVSSGVYFYRLSAEGNGQNFVATKKMMLMK